MSELISIAADEWARHQARCKALALEKSYLQLVNAMMRELSAVPGLEHTAEKIVRLIVLHLGGTNVLLYYKVQSRFHRVDLCGRQELDAVDDPMVRAAFEGGGFQEELRDFDETRMATPAFTKASYWALPLTSGGNVVGVLKTEGMLLSAAEVRRQLEPFFNYAALVLKNEIDGHLRFWETAQLAAIVQSSDDAIIGKDLEGLITSWNAGAERIYGYAAPEMVGRSIAVLVPQGHEDEVPHILAQLREGRHVQHFETIRRRKDGQEIHVSLTISPIHSAAGEIVGVSTIAREITERKRAEEVLHRLNRELRAISNCNQTLMHATNEVTLLQDICRIICDEAGYRMAWVGYAQPDEAKTVRPIAYAGVEDGYLAAAGITWADTERGRGPAGTAIRSGAVACVQDFLTDAQAAPWREKALERGYRSCIALPLKDDAGGVLGVLTIYSVEPNAFTTGEVRLMEELAADLAFGVTVLRGRIERKQAEQERLANLQFFKSMDRVNRAMQGADNLEQMMSDVLDAMLSIFGCDRAFLAVPCDPTMPEFQISMERTTPLYPGASARGVTVPMSPGVRSLFQELLSNPAPNEICVGKGLDPEDVVWKTYEIKSQLAIALHPKVGKPWECGLHQCSHNRVWTPQEKKLFLEISRRLGDALTSLLTYRDLHESEEKYRTLIQKLQAAVVVHAADTRIAICNPVAQTLLGLTEDQLLGKTAIDSAWHFIREDGTRMPIEEYPVNQVLATRQPLKNLILGVHRSANAPDLWAMVNANPVFRRENEIAEIIVTFIDITQRKRVEDALVFVAQRGWQTGVEDFFAALVRFLCEELDMDYALIDKIDENPDMAETVAMCAKGEIAPNLRYALKGTPCDNVMGKRLCVYPQGIQQLFPEDPLLPGMGAESYIGIPLWDSTGRALGLIAVMGTKPLSDAASATQLLQLVATRAAAELERERSDRLLRTREHEFRTLAENLPDNVVRYDREGRTVYVNPALEQTLGAAAARMIGTRIRELNPDGSYEAFAQAVDTALASGKNGEIEIAVPVPGKEQVIHQIRMIVERDDHGEVSGVLAIGRDITERKRAEHEILQLNRELEQRVSERTAQLEAANKELESFAYSVAHDLRAPLRSIDGFSQAVLEDYAGKLDREGNHYLQRIRAGAQRMAQLIDDMLNLSRVTRGEFRLERVNLSALAQEIASELARREPGRKVSFKAAPGLVVTGDSRFLRVALENLLGNAWKFTSKRPEAQIEFGVAQRGGQAEYFVRDNGAGFDMKYAARLFGVFQRLHTAEEFPGSGVGLATVQRIVHRHGGRVWATGEVDKGATLFFTLSEPPVPELEPKSNRRP